MHCVWYNPFITHLFISKFHLHNGILSISVSILVLPVENIVQKFKDNRTVLFSEVVAHSPCLLHGPVLVFLQSLANGHNCCNNCKEKILQMRYSLSMSAIHITISLCSTSPQWPPYMNFLLQLYKCLGKMWTRMVVPIEYTNPAVCLLH